MSSYTTPSGYIPSVVPSIVRSLPKSSVATSHYEGAYIYYSDGVNYKLIGHSGKFTDICTAITGAHPELLDPVRNCWAFGYWSPGGAAF